MRISQIALSVSDLRRSHAWYHEVLGLAPAGGTNTFAGPLSSMVQGLPRAASTCWWLVDRQEHFQIELFEFRSPPVRPFAAGRRPCDVGYTMISFHVADLDAALERAGSAGSPPLSDAVGDPGSRRCCVRDPDGVLIELMEDDPRASIPRDRPRGELAAAARAVTLSVSDLERSRRLLVDAAGLEEATDVALHRAEHEALWGLEGAERRDLLLWADDLLVEVVEYTDPRGRGWPEGYRISDLGLLNIAFGFRDRREWDGARRRFEEAGCLPNGPPLNIGAFTVVYVNDQQGFSYELLHSRPAFDGMIGFRRRRTPVLAPFVGRTPAKRRRSKAFRSALVTGAAGGIGREVCRLLAADGTELVLVDRDAGALERLEAELRDESEARVVAIPLDLADLEAVDAAAGDLARAQDLDLIVAAAGLDRAQSLLSFDWRQAREDYDVNTLANLVLLAGVLPAMAERGTGHVTALSSLAGLMGMPYESAYSGSKAALAATVESARAELGPHGLTFTTVYPGFVDTPMFRANAFRHPYSIPARDAAERIHAATLDRRPELSFPVRERMKIEFGKLLPARVRDRLARAAMDPERVGRDERRR
jgi:short-subunit dehydrogenase/catechol 2,3-dioxygenase-like lactoylglutathione lyase family enzyme